MRLVALTGCRYHAASITCRASLDILQRAKEAGLPVTASASINHLTLNEIDIGPYRTFFKLAPPLRAEDDRATFVAEIQRTPVVAPVVEELDEYEQGKPGAWPR